MMLRMHITKCETNEKTIVKTSSESHLHWNDHFPTNPFYFRIIAVFKADNEIDDSSIGNKTTFRYKQNPVCIGYYIKCELEDVLKSG